MNKRNTYPLIRFLLSTLIAVSFCMDLVSKPPSASAATSPTDIVKNLTLLTTLTGVRMLTPINGVLYFAGQDSTHGLELWKSEGTPETTKLIKNINENSNDSLKVITPVFYKGLVYFVACTDANDYASPCWLYTTDGSAAGTHQVIELEYSYGFNRISVLNNELYFTAGNKLRKTDGITISLVGTIPDYMYFMTNLEEMNGNIYFSISAFQSNPNNDYIQLWVSDGSSIHSLVNFPCMDSFGQSTLMTSFNDLVFFQGCGTQRGGELWQSDGTVEGTLPVDETPTGMIGNPASMQVANGWLFYTVEYDDLSGALYRTLGRVGGTQFIRSFQKPPFIGGALRGMLFFTAKNEQGIYQAWKTNGTPDWVSPIIPAGEAYTQAGGILPVGQWMLFSAFDASHGYEVWMTDGDPQNTLRLTDLPVGVSGVTTITFMSAGENVLYFVYRDSGTYGTRTLYKLELNPTIVLNTYIPTVMR